MKRFQYPSKETLHQWYHIENLNLDEVAARIGCCQEAARKALKAYGIPRKPPINRTDRKHPNKARKGAANGFWKEGYTIDKGGYKLAYSESAGHYVREHRLVMEQKIGRPLLSTEVVHHIDGNVLNNAPENLELFSNNAEHLAATLRGKCPKWSEAGYQNMLLGARRKAEKAAAKRAVLETYARTHNVSVYFLSQLPKDVRLLLRRELEQGRLECPPALLQKRAEAAQNSPVPRTST